MESSTDIQMANIRWPQYAGIFLLSAATLLLEITLTRVLSVANWYHFGFLAVSTALLGFGASGVTLSLWTRLRQKTPLDLALPSLALLFSFVTIVSFWLMQRIPFQPFSLLVDRWQFAYILLYYLVLSAPFFCSGLAISLLLSRSGRQVNRLYAADLIGAGLGCVAICGAMPAFGGSGCIAVVAMLGSLAALAASPHRVSKLTFLAGLTAMGMFALAFVADRALPIRVVSEKHHPLLPVGQSPIYTEWNSFSRIDVYDAPMQDVRRPDPGFRSIIIDAGTAGTGMDDLGMGVRNYLAHAPSYHPPGLVSIGKAPPQVLIIGSGAGREVLEGLYYGASSITAVEINPIINSIVTKRMRQHWGGLFEQPEVRLVTEDGRSFVRRSKERYDAIICINTMTEAALTSGALTISETYLLTREAFQDYWDHLTPNGTMLITDYNLGKLFATIHELFDRLGLGSPADHLVAFRGVVAPFGRKRLSYGFVLQKSKLRKEVVNLMAERVGIGRNEDGDASGRPEILYSPFEKPSNEYQALLSELANSENLERIYASSIDYLRPATDDKPFFHQIRQWDLHLGFSVRRWGMNLGFARVLGAGQKGDVFGTVAQVMLVIMLVQAVFVGGVMILLPLARFHRQGLKTQNRWTFLTYFAALGMGFIMIEMVFLQRLLLFLGEPVYTFSVVLASLLIFTGVGSFLAGRIQDVSYRVLSWYLAAVVAAILVTLVASPPILASTLGLPLPWRVCVAVLIIAPLGVVLGVPFATGLRLVGKEALPLVPWAWAVNGFFTVIGSVGAIILAMIVGFSGVLIFAAGCYSAGFIALQMRATPGRVSDLLRPSPGSLSQSTPLTATQSMQTSASVEYHGLNGRENSELRSGIGSD